VGEGRTRIEFQCLGRENKEKRLKAAISLELGVISAYSDK